MGTITAVARIDHVAFECEDPDAAAAFYEHVLGARIVKAEGHPVMAYLGAGTALALHERGGPGFHVAFRVSEDERAAIRTQLDERGIPNEERDHEIAVGLFFHDPEGRQLEAITFHGAEDPRRP
jgi:catechol 2,3-dioxygenase-like lactoylglutathione lyase family enzyme